MGVLGRGVIGKVLNAVIRSVFGLVLDLVSILVLIYVLNSALSSLLNSLLIWTVDPVFSQFSALLDAQSSIHAQGSLPLSGES